MSCPRQARYEDFRCHSKQATVETRILSKGDGVGYRALQADICILRYYVKILTEGGLILGRQADVCARGFHCCSQCLLYTITLVN